MAKKLMMICAFALAFSGVNLLTPPSASEARHGLFGLVPRIDSRHIQKKLDCAKQKATFPDCHPACRKEDNQNFDECKRREFFDLETPNFELGAPGNTNSRRINGEQNADEKYLRRIYPRAEKTECHLLHPDQYDECKNAEKSAPE